MLRRLDALAPRWPLIAALVSGAMLAAAHAFERFGGLAPCPLCLRQREVYWAALAVGLAGFALTRLRTRIGPRTVSAVLAAVFLFGAGLAAFHAGVEWKWWPGPATCVGGSGSVSLGDLQAMLAGAPVEIPRCDEAAWVFLGLSMAGWNAVLSLLFAAASLRAALFKGGARG